MIETRIGDFEIIRAMDKMSRRMKFDWAYHLALGDLLAEKKVPHKSQGAFGLKPPALLPPYEYWRCPMTRDLVIRHEPMKD